MSTIKIHHLKHLALFSCVIEEGSFAAAARAQGTSRSRVSEQITALEEELGVRLIQRSTRRLSLTQEGRQIYEQARQLSGIMDGVDEITGQSTPKGRVSITATNDIGVGFLLPVLKTYQEQNPEVELNVILSDDKLDLISEGIDLGIRVGIPKDETLIARVLYEDRLWLYATPAYLAEFGTPKTLQDLDHHKWVVLSQSLKNGAYSFHHEGQLKLIKPKCPIGCNSTLMTQAMISAGMGIGAVLPSTMQKEIDRGDLIPILPEVLGEPVVFALVYPSRRQIPLRVRSLIDYIMKSKMW